MEKFNPHSPDCKLSYTEKAQYALKGTKNDPVKHPAHYTSHKSGIECIQVTEHMNFNLGNAIKYIWRADLKGNALEDLEKAKFYIDREIALRSKEFRSHM